MPSVEIPGKIVGIEYEDAVDYEIVHPTGWTGGPGNESVVLEPTGKPRTVVVIDNVPAWTGGGGPLLDLSPDFNVGDVVEIYRIGNTGGVIVRDENGNGPWAAQSNGVGFILRKLRDGTVFPTWGGVAV